jgi:hypothetical protein
MFLVQAVQASSEEKFNHMVALSARVCFWYWRGQKFWELTVLTHATALMAPTPLKKISTCVSCIYYVSLSQQFLVEQYTHLI